MAAQCQRSRFGYHPQLLRIASYAVFFLAEDFRSHFLFVVVNAILMAFFVLKDTDWATQFLIFARQLIMWIMMLISPTPGGSGFAEFVFKEYLGSFIIGGGAGVAIAMAIVWRLITYYPYLFVGVFIVPKWIGQHFGGRPKPSAASTPSDDLNHNLENQ